MTVSQIIQWFQDQYGERNITTPEQALMYLNQVQQMAFDYDLDAFINYDNFITVNALNPQGPYPMPTSPGVRKFIGVTAYSLEQLAQIRQGGTLTVVDFGLPLSTVDERTVYEQIDISVFPPPTTFKFVQDAESIITDPDTYRLVYYMRPPEIRTVMDDSNLWIPEEFHSNMLVEGMKILANAASLGDPAPKAALEMNFRPFWDSMTQSTDLGNRDNLFSEGQP